MLILQVMHDQEPYKHCYLGITCLASHAGNPGSNPGGITNKINNLVSSIWLH